MYTKDLHRQWFESITCGLLVFSLNLLGACYSMVRQTAPNPIETRFNSGGNLVFHYDELKSLSVALSISIWCLKIGLLYRLGDHCQPQQNVISLC